SAATHDATRDRKGSSVRTRRQASHSHKYRDFERQLARQLDALGAAAFPQGDLIPGLNGAPVFKLRMPLGNHGKRGGARLVYYCSEQAVVPLFVYSKNDLTDLTPHVIVDALAKAGL